MREKKYSRFVLLNYHFCREGKAEPVVERAPKAPAESVQKKQSELLKAIQHKKVLVLFKKKCDNCSLYLFFYLSGGSCCAQGGAARVRVLGGSPLHLCL